MFPPDTVKFLRALVRNNDREWFHARKAEYERAVRGPMTALVERLAGDFRTMAPELVATPKVALYRIWRDTRFSDDKRPLKTHAAALFPPRGFAKGEAAGLYIEIAPKWVWLGGGVYMPPPLHLQRIRERLADAPREFQSIVESPVFKRRFGAVDGEKLTRVPRGFPRDHMAAEWLKHKQIYAGREYPADFAQSPSFYKGIVSDFQALIPLVRFLNAPLADLAAKESAARGARR